MKIFRKRILPKIWLSAIAVGVLFLGFAGATVKASNNEASSYFDLTAVSNYLFGSAVLVDSVQFTAPLFTAGESGGFATITVSRTGDNNMLGSVDYSLDDGGIGNGFATGGAVCANPGTGAVDYVNTSGTLTFQPGVTSQTFTVPICSDLVFEGPESFNVLLTNPNNVLIGSPSATVVRIDDNDPTQSGTFQFSQTTFNVGENTVGPAAIMINRTGGTNGAVTVSYTLTGGTATGGAACDLGIDFINTTTPVVFAAGQTSATINVTICDDGIAEGTETFNATITAVSGGNAAVGSPATTTVNILDNEAAGPSAIQFGAATATVREGGISTTAPNNNTVTLNVTRTGNLNGAVTVTFTTANGTALGGSACSPAGTPAGTNVDYITQTGTITFLSGFATPTSQPVIQTCNDTLDEPNETFSLTLGTPTGGAVLGGTTTTTVTILDDENGVFQFTTASTQSVTESTGIAIVTVTRTDFANTGSQGAVTVDYATSAGPTPNATGGAAGTACAAGIDYINQSGTLNFGPNIITQTISIQICNDSAFEVSSENFRVTISNPQSNPPGDLTVTPLLGLTNTVATVTITDDDTANPGVFNISATPLTVTEGTSVTVTITRSGGTDTAVTVQDVTVDETAVGGATCTAGIDYLSDNFSNSFANSQTVGGTQSLNFTITTCNDAVFEPTETFRVELRTPAGPAGQPQPTIGANSFVRISIIDNDAQPGIIQFAQSGTISVREGDGAVTIPVVRTSGTDTAVSVNFVVTNGAAVGGAACTAGVDFINNSGTLNFNSGPTGVAPSTPLVVTICQDTTPEIFEGFNVSLSNPTGGATLGANTALIVGILDDENGTIQFSQANYTATEPTNGSGTSQFTVTVNRTTPSSGANGTVTVNYTLTNGTATGGTTCTGTADYINPAGTPDGSLTFGSGVINQTFNIAICDDLLNEQPETITITLTDADTVPGTPAGGSSGVVIGAQNTATVTITDNDAPPTIVVTPNNVMLNEGTAGAITPFTFPVTLSAASGQAVTVQFATANGSATGGASCATAGTDYITTSGTLTFNAGSTTSTTPLTVQVCGDLNPESLETFTVTFTGAVNATAPATVTGTILNDDGSPGTISINGTGNTNIVRLVEGGNGTQQTATFTLTNTAPDALPATVQFTTGGGTATAGAAGTACVAGVDYITTSGTATFAANSTTSAPITVTICGDTIKEPNEFFFITLSNANNANVPNGTQGIGIIVDDDRSIAADFDRDRRSDFSVFRPSNNFFYFVQSINGLFRAELLGVAGDIPVPGDYDNDGATDIAVYRPSTGTFIIQLSTNNTISNIALGAPGDIPVQADYNGDGATDVAVFRPSNGTFYRSSNPATNFDAVQFGQSGDIPVVGDYDGDGRADVAVFRNGTFFVLRTTGGFFGIQFGQAGDRPIVGDYDGDGRTDFTVYRPSGNAGQSGGVFYTFRSLTQTSLATPFGATEDIPTAGDYDGDGTTDISVFRPSTGQFFVLGSSNNGFSAFQFGQSGDIPVASRYQPSGATAAP